MSLPSFEVISSSGDQESVGERWNRWVMRFENFLVAFAINEEASKLEYLFRLAGDHVLEIYSSLNHTSPRGLQETPLDQAIRVLTAHFNRKSQPVCQGEREKTEMEVTHLSQGDEHSSNSQEVCESINVRNQDFQSGTSLRRRGRILANSSSAGSSHRAKQRDQHQHFVEARRVQVGFPPTASTQQGKVLHDQVVVIKEQHLHGQSTADKENLHLVRDNVIMSNFNSVTSQHHHPLNLIQLSPEPQQQTELPSIELVEGPGVTELHQTSPVIRRNTASFHFFQVRADQLPSNRQQVKLNPGWPKQQHQRKATDNKPVAAHPTNNTSLKKGKERRNRCGGTTWDIRWNDYKASHGDETPSSISTQVIHQPTETLPPDYPQPET